MKRQIELNFALAKAWTLRTMTAPFSTALEGNASGDAQFHYDQTATLDRLNRTKDVFTISADGCSTRCRRPIDRTHIHLGGHAALWHNVDSNIFFGIYQKVFGANLITSALLRSSPIATKERRQVFRKLLPQ